MEEDKMPEVSEEDFANFQKLSKQNEELSAKLEELTKGDKTKTKKDERLILCGCGAKGHVGKEFKYYEMADVEKDNESLKERIKQLENPETDNKSDYIKPWDRKNTG